MSYQNVAEIITDTDSNRTADLCGSAKEKSERETVSEITSSSSEIDRIAKAREYLEKGILDKAHHLMAEIIKASLEPDTLIKAAIISLNL